MPLSYADAKHRLWREARREGVSFVSVSTLYLYCRCRIDPLPNPPPFRGRERESVRPSHSRHLRELRTKLQSEHPRRVAAQNTAFRGLAQKRQIVDRARQVEVPVRIVGRIQQ